MKVSIITYDEQFFRAADDNEKAFSRALASYTIVTLMARKLARHFHTYVSFKCFFFDFLRHILNNYIKIIKKYRGIIVVFGTPYE